MRSDEESAPEEQQPVKRSLCRSLRRDTHWKCLILSLLICGCMAAIAWCRLTVVTQIVTIYKMPFHQTSQASPCEDGYVYIPVAFIVMLYLVYLVECWHCHTRLQLQCKVDVNTVYERIQAMRDAIPIVWWKAVCYHYVRRSRHVTRYRNGDAFTTTQVYYERVNSHTASSCFNFTTCGMKDVSKTLVKLESFPATKIRFSKGYSFSAYDAEQEFEEQRSHFFRSHERMDDYMETREGVDMMNINFKDYMIVFTNPDNLPWYISQVVFWIASFLLLSWPLRVLIEYKTAYVHFHVHKEFGCNYPVDINYSPGRLTRASTMESSELEMKIRDNYAMVPSYSDALLLESAGNDQQQQVTYGTLPTPNGSIPLVHLGNSICVAPAQGTTYANVNANGYIAMTAREPSSRYQCTNNSSSESLSGAQHRKRRKRKRKRRRQSYMDAILGPSDNEAFEGPRSESNPANRSLSPPTCTSDSRSERDSLTLPSRDSSLDMVESYSQPSSNDNGPSGRQAAASATNSDTIRSVAVESVTSPPTDTPPAYEHALSMQRSVGAIPSTRIPSAKTLDTIPPANRPTCLPTTRSRVPAYQRDQPPPADEDGDGPPIRLAETSL